MPNCHSLVPIFQFSPIFPAFCSLLLPTYFSKNFAGKISASLLQSIAFLQNHSGVLQDQNTNYFLVSRKPCPYYSTCVSSGPYLCLKWAILVSQVGHTCVSSGPYLCLKWAKVRFFYRSNLQHRRLGIPSRASFCLYGTYVSQ